jgi:arylsulfatase A-like enzyme
VIEFLSFCVRLFQMSTGSANKRIAGMLFLSSALFSCSQQIEGEPPGADLEGSNLLLITLDTTRADALGCYGGPAWITPNLDRLAKNGVRFDQARSVTPVTLPSHATILTGLYPFEHGVRDNATFRLPERIETMAERLKRGGYTACAVSGAFVLHSTFNLDQGFDEYLDVPRRKLNLGVAEDQRTAAEVVDEALKFLEKSDKSDPIFLWVHFFDPHFPYAPPRKFARKALDGKSARSMLSEELERRMYNGEVAYMDQEIGRLLRRVQELTPRREWLTAAVADHGEGLGDHDEETHAFLLYDTTIRVPMILSHEGLAKGKVVNEPVSIADLAPTIMSLLGVPFGGATGADLCPLIDGSDRKTGQSLVYFETAHPYYNYNWSPLFGILDQGYKLIDGPEPELYDPIADQSELDDLADQKGDTLRSLREALLALAPRTGRSERFELSREDQSRIRGLGYAGSTANSATDVPLLPGRLSEGLRDPREGLRIMKSCTEARSLAMQPSRTDQLRAVEEIEKALREDPRNPTFLLHACSIYFRANMYEEAMEAASLSLEMLESPSAREVQATCLFNLGRTEEAIELLRVNYELHPHDLLSRFKLGAALLKIRKPEESLLHLKFFLDSYEPRDELYTNARQMMEQAEYMLN